MSGTSPQRNGKSPPPSYMRPNNNRTSQRAQPRQLRFGEKPKPPQSQQPRQMEVEQRRGDCGEMEALYARLRDTNDTSRIRTDKLPYLLTYLREYAHSKGVSAEYDEAQTAIKYSEVVKTEISRRSTISDQGTERSVNAADRRAKFEEAWQEAFEDFEELYAKQYKTLMKRHTGETEHFEKLWSNEKTRTYRKPSAKLLQMKQIEKSLAAMGDYERAKQAHIEADELANTEAQIAQENLVRDYNAAKRTLLAKQKKDLDQYYSIKDHENKVLMAQYETDKRNLETRTTIMENKRRQSQARNQKRSIPNVPVTYADQFTVNKDNEVLLPPLRPPNDPALLEEQRERARERNQRQQQFQQQNAQSTLSKYSVDGSYTETDSPPRANAPASSPANQSPKQPKTRPPQQQPPSEPTDSEPESPGDQGENPPAEDGDKTITDLGAALLDDTEPAAADENPPVQ